ncbi:DUF4166 domain-containing protein [Cryptosporangium aurantiacum]|uniref:DUF4166 domain-containing protein n=1 Tax=Cryptosporangium aurantiacum TaxID=134849 RepID=A0A1M7RJX3_9ACTN|nr:DUF4166 domain-containing protein [Cryptosporangium aurantiacum]SHN46613.1 protein of unknown function [Cryptosporangium aurantiacum]
MSGHDVWIMRFHLGDRPVTATGTLDVHRGARWPARVLAAALRLPATGTEVPLRVRIERSPTGGELWARDIGGRRLDSTQRRSGDVVTEIVGPVEIRMRLTVRLDHLEFTPIGGTLRIGPVRIPLPRALAPHTSAVATVGPTDRSTFEVDARIWVPSVGLLLAYRGHVHEEEAGDG